MRRQRRIDCAIATATPLSGGDSLRCDVLCVCVCTSSDGYGDGGRVGSVLLLLPCHTVTRGIRTARVRDWRFSAVPKPGKISILERVCVCVSDSVIEREEKKRVCRADFPFGSWCETGQKQQRRRQCRVFPATNLCGNLSPANWTFDLAAVLGRT